MKKKGFTFVELMVAMAIFLMMVVFIVKLDSNTHKQLRKLDELTSKSNIAYSELERIKTSSAAIQSPKTVGDYRVTITKAINSSMHTDVVEITINVEKISASVDNNPFTLKTHILAK